MLPEIVLHDITFLFAVTAKKNQNSKSAVPRDVVVLVVTLK